MNLISINGFELPKHKIKVDQFAGFMTRKSDVCVKYAGNCAPYSEVISNKEVNNIVISYFNSFYINNDNEELRVLEDYRTKIENPSNYVKQLGKELIDDYNFDHEFLKPFEKKKLQLNGENNDYINCNYNYFNTPKLCLIRLEQLFIQKDLPTWYIFEFLKPNSINNIDKNVYEWIKIITKDFKVNKIRRLKVYLDEYFQYLIGRPKLIYKINKLPLPLNRTNEIKIEEFAGYINRKSIVVLEFIDNNNISLVKSEEANDSFMCWFKAIYGEYSKETVILNEYRTNIEKLNNFQNKTAKEKKIEELGMKLVNDYNNNYTHSENKQCLIDLEQLLVRNSLPTSIIFEYTKRNACPINEELLNYIEKITNLKKSKIKLLKEYLDLYLEYIIYRNKEPQYGTANFKIIKTKLSK